MTNKAFSDPKSFENYFKDIIRLHYKPANVRNVPDNHGGDYGIECYALCGHVFQCYLPEQTSDIPKLVQAQKDKINRDTLKLTKKNAKEIAELLGSTKISRWILATSANKSADVAKFCAQKSLSIRELGINYIADDFEILVHTEDDYRSEAATLKRQSYQLVIDFEKNCEKKVVDWIDENLVFLEKLDKKIPKIIESIERQEQTKNFLINQYLDYQNLLSKLLTDWVDIYQVVVTSVENRQKYLESRFITSPDLLPSAVIKEELSNLEKDILQEVTTLKGIDLELIKWGVVSDWLIRCPLDF